MPTEAAVLEALRPVEDPELHQSIVDLDMVKEVAIDGGRVAVTVALTVAGCPLRPRSPGGSREAVGRADGVERSSRPHRDGDQSARPLAQRLGQRARRRRPTARRPGRTRSPTPAPGCSPIASGKGGVGSRR